jgi:hypothetical protein
LGGRHGCVPGGSSAFTIMGKRSGLFFAILLIAGAVQVKLPIAAAQSSAGSDTFDCPSGVISSVDGSCVSEDQAPTSGLGQLGAGAGGSSASGAYGATSGLSGQYPGLQSSGISSRVQSIIDQGGLSSGQSQLAALEESRLLAIRAPSAPTDFQLLTRHSFAGVW